MKIFLKKRYSPRLAIFSAFLLLLGAFFIFSQPHQLMADSLTTASATLSNPRFSFSGQVDVGASFGTIAINIKTSGNIADKNTNHLFPKDPIAIGPIGNLTVSSIVDTDTFMVGIGLTVPVSDADPIYATQSGTLTVAVTTANNIPANGDIIVTIPDPATNGNDSAPDTAESTTLNGFDFNTITTSNVTCPTGANWSVTSATAGNGTTGHKVICTTNAQVLAGTALTMVIGDGTKGLINPAPIYSGHTQGLADTYTITVQTRDLSDNVIDDVNTKVAPVEAVLVSATVDMTLTFQVQGVNTGTSACGTAATVTTTPTSVPWSTISTADVFKNAAQQLTVSTNADDGYSIKVEENDQMGKNGKVCTGATAGEALSCIMDTTCNVGTPCDQATASEWIDPTNYRGLGYSLQNVDGSDAAFRYNSDDCTSTLGSGTGSFCAKQFPDQEVTPTAETKETIMTNSAPVNSKDIYVCYRIAISGTQPAGYYFNKVKYTATAIF